MPNQWQSVLRDRTQDTWPVMSTARFSMVTEWKLACLEPPHFSPQSWYEEKNNETTHSP